MHPAASIIFFTTASGAGYGLMAWLAFLGARGQISADPWLGGVGLLVATAHRVGGRRAALIAAVALLKWRAGAAAPAGQPAPTSH
mgnify:CR=1 FL=1